MIHCCNYEKGMFEKIATRRCCSLVMMSATEVKTGDFVAVNEIGNEEANLSIDGVECNIEYASPLTGRWCLLHVSHVQELSGTGHTIASVHPCDIQMCEQHENYAYGGTYLDLTDE